MSLSIAEMKKSKAEEMMKIRSNHGFQMIKQK